MDFADQFQPNADNPSGTKLMLSFAPLDDFETIAKPADNPSVLGELSTIADDHAFKTGKCFKKFELEVNKNELLAEIQGAVVGGSEKFDINGFQSNFSPAQADTSRLLRRTKHIILLELPDGQVLQLGQENNGAMVKLGMQTGTQEGGERGMPLNVVSYHYAQFYTGTVSYTPAV